MKNVKWNNLYHDSCRNFYFYIARRIYNISSWFNTLGVKHQLQHIITQKEHRDFSENMRKIINE